VVDFAVDRAFAFFPVLVAIFPNLGFNQNRLSEAMMQTFARELPIECPGSNQGSSYY